MAYERGFLSFAPFREYVTAFGRWSFFWAIDVALGILGLIPFGPKAPAGLAAIALGIGFLLAPFIAFQRLRGKYVEVKGT